MNPFRPTGIARGPFVFPTQPTGNRLPALRRCPRLKGEWWGPFVPRLEPEETAPMTRTRVLTRFLCPLFAFALLAVGVRAADPEQPKADDLKDIRDLLTKIEQRMANQQTTNDVLMDIVRKDLRDLREDVARLQREL